MKQNHICFVSSTSLVLFLFLISPARGQLNVGDYTISGGGEIGGLPMGFKGDRARFEEYRDIPETIIVPQLQLMIGGKKEDYYLHADSYKTGLDDQSYTLRVGRYGLLDMEFQWDQIPHWFSDVARTPYVRSGGHTTYFSLFSKPTATTASPVCATSPTCQWVNATAQPIDLSLYNGIARFKVRYTPTPGWTFTGGYWQNHNVGSRAFGALFGSSPGSFNITELPEPIDYQTYNIELGGEYAANGWSVGLKYNGSIFNNQRSSIVWDNPMNLTGVGTACQDSATLNYNTGTGACRGRMDLYPNNQAHTVTLSGAAKLPYKSNFIGTVSYGWRIQDSSFLPFTVNSCYGSGPVPASCADASLTPLPTISRSSLSGDVRPLMVNATVVNNFFDRVNLKAFYRYYGLSNHSSQVELPEGFINLDTGQPTEAEEPKLYSYSKNSMGFEAGYNFARWLSAKWSYGYDRMHRHDRETFNADEFSMGPTFDIKPNSDLLLRASYRYLWRNISAYNASPEADASNVSRKFDEAARRRNKASLFASYTPLDNLELHWGFELTTDRYLYATLGAQRDNNFSPSVGFVYTPLNWLRVFADYNWDRNDWKLDTMDRTSTVTQTPANSCFPAVPINQNRCWTSSGRDISNTISLGSDMDIIPNLLGFRLQYTFSNGRSIVTASGDEQSSTPAGNYPIIRNQWYELLARFEYKVWENLALRFGYYFNHATEQDFGVDIMKQWMGDVDVVPTPNANVARSIFLGDRVKGPFTANVGFVTLAFKF